MFPLCRFEYECYVGAVYDGSYFRANVLSVTYPMSAPGCSFTTDDLKFASLTQILPEKYSDTYPSESSLRGTLLFGRMYIEKSAGRMCIEKSLSCPDTTQAVFAKISSPGYKINCSLSKSLTLISIK